jgi:cyclic di-GMP phosphodiesterase
MRTATQHLRLHKDLHMPGITGFDVLSQIRGRLEEPESLPVIVLTADETPDARHRALSLGARDFLGKPIDRTELLLRVRNLVIGPRLGRRSARLRR